MNIQQFHILSLEDIVSTLDTRMRHKEPQYALQLCGPWQTCYETRSMHGHHQDFDILEDQENMESYRLPIIERYGEFRGRSHLSDKVGFLYAPRQDDPDYGYYREQFSFAFGYGMGASIRKHLLHRPLPTLCLYDGGGSLLWESDRPLHFGVIAEQQNSQEGMQYRIHANRDVNVAKVLGKALSVDNNQSR